MAMIDKIIFYTLMTALTVIYFIVEVIAVREIYMACKKNQKERDKDGNKKISVSQDYRGNAQ